MAAIVLASYLSGDAVEAALRSIGAMSLLRGAWDGIIASIDSLNAATRPVTSSLPQLTIPAFQSGIDSISASAALDVSTGRFLLCMLLAYPIGALYSLLPDDNLKHSANMLLGVFLAQFVYGFEWVHIAAAALGVYLLLLAGDLFTPIRAVRQYLVFLWMMAYLTCIHVYRMHVDYMGWSLDISGPIMVLTMKMTALAWNVHDGQRDTQAAYAKLRETSPGMARMLDDRTSRAVGRTPNPIQFFGYVFAFSSIFAGPAFEFSEYMRATSTPAAARAARVRAVLTKLFSALVYLAIAATITPRFPFSRTYSPAMLYEAPLLTRVGYAWLALLLTRVRYYAAWVLSEGACNAAGYGYTREGGWDGVAAMDVLGFELAPDITAATKAWNKMTQSWLARYCGQRVPRAWSMLAVYALSAFWHGFYPGYYLFFLSAPLFQHVEGAIKVRITPRVAAAGKVAQGLYSAISLVCVSLALNYMVCPFVALGWDRGVNIWASFYFGGHVACIVLSALLMLVPVVKTKIVKKIA